MVSKVYVSLKFGFGVLSLPQPALQFACFLGSNVETGADTSPRTGRIRLELHASVMSLGYEL